MNKGWIKLHRKLLNSPTWHLSPSHLKVFVACLLLANNQDRKWFNGKEEVRIPRGSFITSQPKLAELTHLSRRQIMRAFENLSKLGSIRYNAWYKKYTVITIVNFEAYQAPQVEEGQDTVQARYKSGTSPVHNVRSKERKNKNYRADASEASSAHQEVMDLYHKLFTEKFGTTPLIDGGKDGKILKDLLAKRKDPAEVKELLGLFFKHGTKYVRDNGRYDLAAFRASYNELLVMRGRGDV